MHKQHYFHMKGSAVVILFLFLISSCALMQPTPDCPEGTQNLPQCPPIGAVNDDQINRIYEARTWKPVDELDYDPVTLGEEAKIPINQVGARVIGPSYEEAVQSLATKLWLIEHAQHTVDVMYYIFARDKVGYAVIGALCDAVKRGVDVRIMVDSLGSMRPLHSELKALLSCQEEAGFMRNANGEITTKKARVQAVIFNSLTKLRINRRAHDKLLVTDGSFPKLAYVMLGGRNISLDYYGINDDGSVDPTAFRDMEILLHSETSTESASVGEVTQIYYNLLFEFEGNRVLEPPQINREDYFDHTTSVIERELKNASEALLFLKNQKDIKVRMAHMEEFLNTGFITAQVRLAHQLGNLTASDVVDKHVDIMKDNPNSIMNVINNLIAKAEKAGVLKGDLRIISPYLFVGQFNNEDGEVVLDGAKIIHQLLEDNPELNIELITNSVMTSDNAMTQSIIDIEMVPRLLLTEVAFEQWKGLNDKDELDNDLVNSDSWKQMINHERLTIYQTGKLDSVLLGGDVHYGKLHAKFVFGDKAGFVGTTNFDYRSLLYNSESGFVYHSQELSEELNRVFQRLKNTSYQWGTHDWLLMRHQLMGAGNTKGTYTRYQREIYKTLNGLGLKYLM